jgi:hypothetical protein
MLRDNLAGLIEPMRAARELNPLALFTEQKKSSDDRPQDALKIPAPKGRNLTLTENAASPFHAEPRHKDVQEISHRMGATTRGGNNLRASILATGAGAGTLNPCTNSAARARSN